jgi:hypothetical protein
VINGSRGKSYENQRAILAKCGPSVPYAVPTALDVTVAIFMDHVKTGTKRYADNPATHTRCQGYDRCNLIVGGFSDAGLEVFTDYDGPGRENVGLGGSLYLEA